MKASCCGAGPSLSKFLQRDFMDHPASHVYAIKLNCTFYNATVPLKAFHPMHHKCQLFLDLPHRFGKCQIGDGCHIYILVCCRHHKLAQYGLLHLCFQTGGTTHNNAQRKYFYFTCLGNVPSLSALEQVLIFVTHLWTLSVHSHAGMPYLFYLVFLCTSTVTLKRC